MPEEFVVADNLDIAWSNFDPLYPLPANCPFHVEREDKPLNKLKRALLREHRQPPKYFFSGHRGAANQLNSIYWLQKKLILLKEQLKVDLKDFFFQCLENSGQKRLQPRLLEKRSNPDYQSS